MNALQSILRSSVGRLRMNITNDYTQNRLTPYKPATEQVTRVSQEPAPVAQPRSVVQTETRADSVQFSDNAKLLAAADRVARDDSEARADKIARLREEVSNGTYTVDSRRVAESLVREEHMLFIV